MDLKNLDKPEMTNGLRNNVVQEKAVKKTSWLAIAALIAALLSIIFGVVSLFISSSSYFFTFRAFGGFSIVALLLGAVAIIRIKFGRKILKGYEYAFIAIALAFFCVLGWGSMARFIEYKIIRTSKYTLKKLGKEISQYCQANNGYMPVAEQWCDLLLENNKNLSRNDFKHPFLESWKCNFAFNKNLSSLRLTDVPDNTVLVFETDGNWNLTGTEELLKERLHFINTYILFADGSVYRYQFEGQGILKQNDNSKDFSFEPLRWEP